VKVRCLRDVIADLTRKLEAAAAADGDKDKVQSELDEVERKGTIRNDRPETADRKKPFQAGRAEVGPRGLRRTKVALGRVD